jgi:hypothetical protein
MFLRNILPPSSSLKTKPSRQQARIKQQDPEGEGSIFLQNIGGLLPDYRSSHPR